MSSLSFLSLIICIIRHFCVLSSLPPFFSTSVFHLSFLPDRASHFTFFCNLPPLFSTFLPFLLISSFILTLFLLFFLSFLLYFRPPYNFHPFFNLFHPLLSSFCHNSVISFPYSSLLLFSLLLVSFILVFVPFLSSLPPSLLLSLQPSLLLSLPSLQWMTEIYKLFQPLSVFTALPVLTCLFHSALLTAAQTRPALHVSFLFTIHNTSSTTICNSYFLPKHTNMAIFKSKRCK